MDRKSYLCVVVHKDITILNLLYTNVKSISDLAVLQSKSIIHKKYKVIQGEKNVCKESQM